MKHLITSTLLMLAMLLPATAYCGDYDPGQYYDFAVDGIAYNYSGSGNVELTIYEWYWYAPDEWGNPYYESAHNRYSGDFVIPETVTYNGETYTVTGINIRAFEDCPDLISVRISRFITSIDNNMFYGLFRDCNRLSSITVDNENTKYDSRNNCNAIIETASKTLIAGCKNTIVPNSVTVIGQAAFENCSTLSNITIPNSITSIGRSAFSHCSGLTSIEIPNSVTSIGDDAFEQCSNLTEIIIGNSVTTINAGVFYGCSGLTSVTIPNSVTNIGSNAFYGCSGLTSVTIPNSVTSIGSQAFYNCRSLTNVNITDLKVWCNISFNSHEDNPLYYAHHLYLNGSEVTNLIIPNSVTAIKDYTFAGYTGSVTIPNSVTSLYNKSFYESHLINITVDTGNSVYDSRDNCNAVISTSYNNLILGSKNTVIPNTVTEISEWAFYGNNELTAITIPESIKRIGDNAFANCSALETLNFNAIACNDFAWYVPDEMVGDGGWPYTIHEHYEFRNPFKGTNLLTINIGNHVQRIPSNFAINMKNVKCVTIPVSITSVGDFAFQGCSSIDTLIFNAIACCDFNFNRQLYWGNYELRPFKDSNISVLNLGDSIKNIPAYLAYGCTRLTSLAIPSSVTSIGDYTFYGCSGLFGALTIPDSVTSIGAYAFYDCSGISGTLSIPSAVASIGKQAFDNIPGFETVACKANTPPSWDGLDMFTTNVYNHTPLFVPLGCARAYMSDQCWGQFARIVSTNDVNMDGYVSISDVTSLISLLLTGSSNPAADVNGDGKVSISDVTALINLLLSGGGY